MFLQYHYQGPIKYVKYFLKATNSFQKKIGKNYSYLDGIITFFGRRCDAGKRN